MKCDRRRMELLEAAAHEEPYLIGLGFRVLEALQRDLVHVSQWRVPLSTRKELKRPAYS